jgi:hypothetical protein
VRIRNVDSETEMERWIDEMITLGYDVKDRGVGTAQQLGAVPSP